MLYLSTYPCVSRKKAKNFKKSVDIIVAGCYYIQVDAIRQQNKSQIARQ